MVLSVMVYANPARHDVREQIRIAAVTLFKFLQVLALVALILGVVRIVHMFRARAMRALAARWGFQYIGPPAP
jgi:hypothetical protein